MDNKFDNVVDSIGRTPLIKLNKILENEGVKCKVWAKCEYMNPGGSSKDRIGKLMIERAVEDGSLKPGGTVVESTSGNTGIGLALNCIIKGFKCLITIPDKMSMEKVNILKNLGAEVVICDTAAPYGNPNK